MKTMSKLGLGIVTAAVMAASAQASMIDGPQADADKATTDRSVKSTHTVQTLDADGRVGELTLIEFEESSQVTDVLGALEMQETEAYIVQDNDGRLFINHLVPIESLQDPELEVDTVETYEISYRGMTFTNKIVDPQ
jgi:hypothetical protein